MKNMRLLGNSLLGALLVCLLICSVPALAQSEHPDTTAAQTGGFASAETAANQSDANSAIKPKGISATIEEMPANVNKLANLEALLNIIGNGVEVLCMATGVPLLLGIPIGAFLHATKPNMRKFTWIIMAAGPALIGIGLVTAQLINLLIAGLHK